MSETRKRTKIIPFRVNAQEAAIIDKLTFATGQSAAALLRNTLLRIPLPRARKSKVDAGLFGKALSRLAALNAELGKEGSNLNQLTYYVNVGRPVERLAGSLEVCLHNLDELQRDALELRTLFMQAMGLEPPNHRGPDGDE